MLKTCYTKDPISRSLIPNPALSVLSDLATSCEEKMQSLDDFLAEFVADEDGEAYAEYKESKSKPQSSEEQSSEEQALTTWERNVHSGVSQTIGICESSNHTWVFRRQSYLPETKTSMNGLEQVET